jgi:hypothetical protein
MKRVVEAAIIDTSASIAKIAMRIGKVLLLESIATVDDDENLSKWHLCKKINIFIIIIARYHSSKRRPQVPDQKSTLWYKWPRFNNGVAWLRCVKETFSQQQYLPTHCSADVFVKTIFIFSLHLELLSTRHYYRYLYIYIELLPY